MGNRFLSQRALFLFMSVIYLRIETEAGEVARRTTYTLTNATSLLPYLPQRLLDPGWSDIPAILSCALKSVNKYNTSKGFLYNSSTKICTPVLWLTDSGNDGAKEVSQVDGQLYLRRDVCPDDFTLYDVGTDGKYACIKYTYVTTWYTDARNTCNTWGGHLAAVKTLDKLELVRKIAGGKSMWIGLDDLASEGEYIWQLDRKRVTEKEMNTVFATGEPNNRNNGEDCVQFGEKSSFLNDISCSARNGFLCEMFLPS